MKKLALFIICLFSLVFCTDQEEIPRQSYPLVSTNSVENITREGADFKGKITRDGNARIIEQGFVWGLFATLSLENSDRAVFENTKSSTFKVRIETTLEENKTYYVRAYVRTENLVVYGPAVQFVSLGSKAPVITNFKPSTAQILDTINIEGLGFSYLKTKNEIKFSGQSAQVVSATDTLLRVIVPAELTLPKSRISVSVSGNIAQTASDFQLQGATITGVTSKTIGACDTLAISGENFNATHSSLQVLLNETDCTILTKTVNEIHILVPTFFPTGSTVNLKVISSNIETVYDLPLTYKKSQFLSVVPRANTTFNDTVVVKAKNLPRCATMKVKLHDVIPLLVNVNDSTVAFVIPESLTVSSPTLSITFDGSPLTFNQSLPLSQPSITSAGPKNVTFNDVVTIIGKNFHPQALRNSVYLGGVKATITSATTTKIITRIPPLAEGNCGACKNTILEVNGASAVLANSINLQEPTITAVMPSPITTPGLVTITGNFFNPQADLNSVVIDNPATVVSASKTQVIASVDLNTVSNGNPYVSSQSFGFASVQTGAGSTAGLGVNFDYKGPWTKKANFPGVNRVYPLSFSVNNKLYMGMGLGDSDWNLRDLWEFNPTNNNWVQKANFPGPSRYNCVHFTLNGKVYIGLGVTAGFGLRKDFWEYNPATDTWTQKNDFPGEARSVPEFFVVDNTAYIVGGSNGTTTLRDVWRYNSGSDSWVSLNEAPEDFTKQNSFVIGNKAYCVQSTASSFKIYEYNNASDSWAVTLNSTPGIGTRAIPGGYIFDINKKFQRYNPATNSLTTLLWAAPSYVDQSDEVVGKQYLFGRVPFSGLTELWEFDVSRYPD
ncbi:MAG: IPT/TIG domain-containing protein [Cyclobacteriaceae bacterium]|nr:IPT/TIG domain-containing protein [Cyclobacteriaceae bacterium]